MADDQEQQLDQGAPAEGVELDSEESPSAAAEQEATNPSRRRKGFRSGLVFGIVAGLVAALVMRPKSAAEQAVDSQPPADADGAIAGLRSRLREAADEARQAAHEAEEAKRARFSELLERE